MVLPEKNLLFLFAGLLALLAVLGTVWLAYFSAPPESPEPGPGPQPPRPPPENGTPPPQPPSGLLNIVVIYTDDQRWDTLWAMPNVQEELAQKGITFTNAFITTPVCCPSRASFLSGGYYVFNTHVLSNNAPNGSAERFDDEETIATLLQKSGYKTAHIGKYMNGYGLISPKVPPGWDVFIANYRMRNWSDFDVISGSSSFDSPTQGNSMKITQYFTSFLEEKAIEFIENNSEESFFLYLTPIAPHTPSTPAPGDENLFSDYLYDALSLHEEDLSDKPSFAQESDIEDEVEINGVPAREIIRNHLRSLQAVDRMVKSIVDKLEEKNLLEKTFIVFTSDNGFMWGEHGAFFKSKPYEESIRVPLVIRVPGIQKTTINDLVAVNLDIPQTILALAGASNKPADGKNLMPLLTGEQTQWRSGLAFQIYNFADMTKNWIAWRTLKYKYIEYPTGDKEFYDLEKDPFELESQHDNTEYAQVIQEYSEKLRPLTGLTINYENLPGGSIKTVNNSDINTPYSFKLEAIGGTTPYKWEVTDKTIDVSKLNLPQLREITCQAQFPEGLSMSEDGYITGTPTKKDTCLVVVKITDSSSSPFNQEPQSIFLILRTIVN